MRIVLTRLGAAFALQALLAVSALAANQAPTTTITAPADGTLYSTPASVTFTASATDPDGTVASVQYFNGTVAISSAITVSPYTFTWNQPTAGTYSITAKATDNLGKVGAASAAVQLRIVSVTTVISQPTPNAALPITSDASVTGTFTGSSAGTSVIVTSNAGHSVLAAISGNTFGAGVPVAKGPGAIEVQVARADGTAEITSVNIIGVTQPAAVITQPMSCAVYTVTQPITFTAEAMADVGTISKVEFFADGNSIGSVATPPYSISTTLTAGNHQVWAYATSSYGVTAITANTVIVTVTAPNVPPSVTLTAPAAGAVYQLGQAVTLAATASDSDGTVSGVDFFANGGRIGGSATSPYQLTWTPPTTGTYDLAAQATDNSGASTTSVSVRISVNSPPSVQITAPVQNAMIDAPANTTITAAATDSDGRVVQVQFFVNGVSIGASTTAPYAQSWVGSGPGTYTLTAVASDDTGSSVTSAPVTVKVAVHTDPGETIAFLHNDFAGNAIAATDTTGALIWRENYRPYGERMRRDVNSASNRQWFGGKPEDIDTGLLYLGARCYDPTLARFTSTDPVIFEEKNVHSFNRYAYANNNPLKYVDPDGKHPILIAMGVGALVGGGANALSQYITTGTVRWGGLGGVIDAAGDGMLFGLAAGSAASAGASGAKQAATGNFTRELTAGDLGVKGALQELRGSFAVQDGVATVRVEMIRGEIQNPLQIISNMENSARAAGASTLRVEGTIANERLYDVLLRRYGLASDGATDSIVIPLK